MRRKFSEMPTAAQRERAAKKAGISRFAVLSRREPYGLPHLIVRQNATKLNMLVAIDSCLFMIYLLFNAVRTSSFLLRDLH